MDTGSNAYGRRFLEVCKSTPLRILNGRVLGDLCGNYTCMTSQGRSVVDYAALTPALLCKVDYFKVEDFTPFSDHAPNFFWLKS